MIGLSDVLKVLTSLGMNTILTFETSRVPFNHELLRVL